MEDQITVTTNNKNYYKTQNRKRQENMEEKDKTEKSSYCASTGPNPASGTSHPPLFSMEDQSK